MLTRFAEASALPLRRGETRKCCSGGRLAESARCGFHKVQSVISHELISQRAERTEWATHCRHVPDGAIGPETIMLGPIISPPAILLAPACEHRRSPPYRERRSHVGDEERQNKCRAAGTNHETECTCMSTNGNENCPVRRRAWVCAHSEGRNRAGDRNDAIPVDDHCHIGCTMRERG